MVGEESPRQNMYTNVSYQWADPLAPGGHVIASYKVRVK